MNEYLLMIHPCFVLPLVSFLLSALPLQELTSEIVFGLHKGVCFGVFA